MKYEAPVLTLLAAPSDVMMVSLKDLFAVDLWDLLVEGL